MSTPVAPPRKKARRLANLNNSSLISGTPKPTQPDPSPPPAPPPATKYNCCPNPSPDKDDEGNLVCKECYTQLSESNIVSDVTFSEDARGAATVQGGFIGANARHASTLGANIIRSTGAGERNSAQEIERNARKALDKLCPTLGIAENTRNQAINIFSLASRGSFSAGRRTDEVAAASLYAACRRQKQNTVMLIDISEILQMNVFRLGEVYKDMCKDLHLNEGGVGIQFLVDVETLVDKYCRKLEFGEATGQVANDALQIVRRMRRDWMVTGRHPAGICGACIILAARMNNFRRTTREVVYIAKVADITIAKRVEEFRRLKAATLTVQQFRDYGLRLKGAADPPVLYESELRKNKLETLKRKRRESTMARDTAQLPDESQRGSRGVSIVSIATDDDAENRSKRPRMDSDAPVTPPDTQQDPRRDADGFLIPPLPLPRSPADQEREETGEPKRRRGRPKKTPPEPIIITEEELAEEAQLEDNINEHLNDDEIIDMRNEVQKAKAEEEAIQIAGQQKQIAADNSKARREAAGITWVNGGSEHDADEDLTPEALERMFANDPEVQNCLLSESEQKVKEQIWVTHNEDWLRQQQEKALIEQVAKAHGHDQVKRRPGKGGKRKRSKMGDGTTLAETTTPIETPGDAVDAMLEKRNAPLSKYIDWDALNAALRVDSSRSTSARGSATPTSKGASNVATPLTGPGPFSTRAQGSASPSPVARSDVSVTPSPLDRRASAAVPESVESTPAPTSPEPQTQAGAEDEEEYDDPNDYVSDENTYQDDESDRESIGEEGWQNAAGSLSSFSLRGNAAFEGEFD